MAETPPSIFKTGDKDFRVTPQRRFERLLEVNPELKAEVAQSTISANRRHKGAETFSSVDGLPLLIVEELEYPGDIASHPFGKWAYLIHAGKNIFLAEMCSESGLATEGWRYRDFPTPDDDAAKRDILGPHWMNVSMHSLHVAVPLTCLQPGEDPTVVRVYLSPYQLSPAAMRMLLSGQAPNGRPMSEALVKPIWSQPKPAYAAVPDPMSWPLEAKTQFYEPRLKAYQNVALDEKAQARHAIAGVVKAWIANGDPADVEDELAQKPDQYFAAFEAQVKPLREKAEEAAAYIGECMSGPEHYVAEAALADAHVDVDLNRSLIIQHWAVAVERLQETAAGTHFLIALVDDKKRVPFRFVLDEFSPLSFTFFEGHRWGSLGALAIVGELMPTWVAKMAKANIPELTIEQKAISAVKRLGIVLDSNNKKRAYEWLIANKPGEVSAKHMKKIKQWSVKFDLSNLPAQDAAEIRKKTLDAAEKGAESKIRMFRYPVQAVLEITNLALAISSFKADSAWQGFRSTTSIIGASVDLTAFVMEVSLMRELAIGARQTLKKRLAVLAIISGVLDGFEHCARVGDGVSQRDYGKSVGHAIAALGAGAVAVGGVLSLMAVGAGAGSVLGPLGAIIGAAGALVMVVGSLIASYLKLNAYEQYARHCFLGRQADAGSRVKFPWSMHDLPVSDPVEQLEVLLGLLSNFRVKVRGSGGPIFGPATGQPFGFIEIFPGDTDHAAVLEIDVIHTYIVEDNTFSDDKIETMTTTVRFPLNEAPFMVADNRWTMVPHLGFAEIERNPDLSVKRFSLPIQPAFWRANTAAQTGHYKDYPHRFSTATAEYKVRLLGAGRTERKLIAAPLNKKCKIEAVSTSEVASIDDSTFSD